MPILIEEIIHAVHDSKGLSLLAVRAVTRRSGFKGSSPGRSTSRRRHESQEVELSGGKLYNYTQPPGALPGSLERFVGVRYHRTAVERDAIQKGLERKLQTRATHKRDTIA